MSEASLQILIVDDERAIRRFLRAALVSHSYQVIEADTGQSALAAAADGRPDVVILDLGLPDMDGVEVTRQLREWYQGPIIILSVRDQENDKIAALDAGADDYLTKPFGMGELMARIRVILRRSNHPADEPIFEVDDLKVDLPRRIVTLSGQEVDLTPTEYDILRILVQHSGRVLTHRQILREVWGAPYETETHLLRVNMSNLRRKIEPDPDQPHYIVTEPGVGYRLRTSG
jgi:two-component system, OmpR family, KDP operon response regulator KdpE